MRYHNVMPTNAQIRECFAVWEDDGNHPKSLEELAQIMDDVVEAQDRFWNYDEDVVV